MVLVAIGRMPYLENLGLENTKVKVNERGRCRSQRILRNRRTEHFRPSAMSSPRRGSRISQSNEGIVVVEKLAGKKVEPINMRLVPNCTYCDPEVASVGLTEAKAKEEGYDVKVGKFPFSASGKARILGETDGFIKIVSDKKI